MAKRLPFLRTSKTNIVDESGRTVVLKGVALGGWLMMEGYMMCGRNIPEREFKAGLEKTLGREAVEDFTNSFRDLFVRESDIRLIKNWGANCVRVPFNYRVVEFEDKPFSLNTAGLKYLDNIVEWCEHNGIYCILDMHAAPGAQNEDWHSDPAGNPTFFFEEANKNRYMRLWHFLADRYRDSSTVAGYDVLNEPNVPITQENLVKDVYDRVTKEIRDADKNHIIFLEGNFWGQRFSFLGKPADTNTAFSLHAYPIADYAFNWETDLVYPGRVWKIMWNKDRFELLVKQYYKLIKTVQVPMYIGEFGANWRGGHYGEVAWTKDLLDIFKKYALSWTYWTYKTVANSVFPDGIWRYTKNAPWINRKGPVTGWENFYTMWTKEKGKIMSSWRTENFTCNEKLYALLKRHFK